MTRGGQVNRNPGTERLATEARSTSPIPSYTEAGRAGQVFNPTGRAIPHVPLARKSHCSALERGGPKPGRF
jgi:hypothetical protein